uniref:Uncharacterized protein n=1 Tax=Melopsittacus undulatus TaxID=13146 RepID=A0A8C6K4F3_MELUD
MSKCIEKMLSIIRDISTCAKNTSTLCFQVQCQPSVNHTACSAEGKITLWGKESGLRSTFRIRI